MISLKRYALFLVLAFALTATATSAWRSQTTTTSSPVQLNHLDSPGQLDVPIADLNAPEPAEPDKRAKRLLRGKRHNLRDKNLTAEDVKRFAVREDDAPVSASPSLRTQTPERDVTVNEEQPVQQPVIGGAVTEHTPPEQPFPVGTSDAVVIGEVTKASAYLSEDKTSVFSEFTTNIKEVLTGNGSQQQVFAGSSLAVLRPGGGVRFPSGRVRVYDVDGRTYPRAGRRYVLFLKHDAIDQSFYIVTGYELRDGKVFPLDGVPRGGTEHHPLALYGKYKGMDEAAFLTELKQAIAGSAQQTSRADSNARAARQESAQ